MRFGGFLFLAISGCASTPVRGDADASPEDAGVAPDVLLTTDARPCMGPAQCSSDLHSVLDCAGHVLVTCPPDQGCGGGTCIPACDSADANESTAGCDYFTFEMEDELPYASGNCYAVFVANTWNAPVELGVEREGTTFDVAKFARIPKGSGTSMTYDPLPGGKVPPGEVAILFLADMAFEAQSGHAYCPVTPAISTPLGVQWSSNVQGLWGTRYAPAFHITASAPVTAYDIFPYGGGAAAVTSASLLLPTSAWGSNYVAVDAWLPNEQLAWSNIAFVAKEDGTNVTIRPTTSVPAGMGVAPATAGQPQTYAMNRGQVLQLALPNGGFSGSPVRSNKPIALFTSTGLTLVRIGAADSAHQQLPPVKALGHEYVAVRYRNRVEGHEEAPPWRLVGAVDGTKLSYDPPQSGAPTALAAGEEVTFAAPGPFVVSSQDDKHPFYASAQMTGCNDASIGGYTGPEGCAGDPEAINIVASDEWLPRYTFFTDPTYPETNLVFVRRTNSGNVTLDCFGTVTDWTAIGTGKFEYARVDLVRHVWAPQGTCSNGVHEAHGDAPFALTVWGWGTNETGGTPQAKELPFSQAVSYAYPAGMGLRTITTVIVPPVPK